MSGMRRPEPGTTDRCDRSDRLGRRFLAVWSGQTVSAIGSEVSGLGIAVYVFVETGSATWLGLLTALATLPRVLALPYMTVVDRLPRRTMMLLGDSVAALGPVLLLLLALIGEVAVWQLGVAAFVTGTGSAFQAPAAQAAVPLLVAPGALGRANGLMQLGPAVGIVVGPLLAAPLVAWWGLTVVLVVDLVTFAVAVATVAAVRFAEPVRPADAAPTDLAWRPALDWLNGPGRPLRTLLFTGAAVNGVLALFNLGLLALATEIAGPARAGLPIAAIGVALVAGSLWAGARGVADDRIGTFTLGLTTTAVGCAVAAAGPHLELVIVGGVLAVVLIPAVNAASATIFQEHVPPEMQGRVFGLRGAIGGALYPISAALGGLLIDRVGAPLMDGPLAGSLGRLIGAGSERGAALVVLSGGLALAGLGVYLARSPIRAALHADTRDDKISVMSS